MSVESKDGGVKKTTLGGITYHILRATIGDSRQHINCAAIEITFAQLKQLYLWSDGFQIIFNNSPKKVTIVWQALADYTEDIILFGPPRGGCRVYSESF